MRRGFLALLAALCLLLPVSAQAAGGVLVLGGGAGDVRLEIKNDAAYPVYVLARAEEAEAGAVSLAVRQGGRSAPVFSGDAAALSGAERLLCTLEPHESAAVVASSGGGGVSLHLSERQAADAVQPDYGRLILWSCIWMALVILGSYVTIAISNRKKRGKQEENR